MVAGAATRDALRAAGARPLLLDASGAGRTGEELERGVEGLTAALHERRLGGRTIGLWYENGMDAVEAFLAVERAGCTRVPVDPGAPADEARAVFAAAGVDAVLADAAHGSLLGDAALVHDDAAPLVGRARPPAVEVDPGRTLHLYPRMASGGRLFGVPISYGNWEETMRVNEALFRGGAYGPGFAADECFLTVQQLMHGTGVIGSFPFLRMGLPQVLLPRFDPASVVDACARHRATATFFVPGMVKRLADALDHAGPTGLRRILYGGAPIGVEEIRRAVGILGPVLVQLYGRFEGGWPLTVLGPADHDAIAAGDDGRARSCGRPIPQAELRLRPVPGVAEGGELCVRSGMVVQEYADPDGWCALGDLAVDDERGYLYLRGRLDGMINTGSYHVYPDEVQEALAAVPGVAAALVRGEPDPAWGQAVTAYVVPAPDAGPDLLDRLRERLPARLARYKIPKAIHVVERLPAGGPPVPGP